MSDGLGSFGQATAPTRKVLSAGQGVVLLKSGTAEAGSLLGYGNGRSYGDTCQAADGSLIDMRPMNQILSFDTDTGLVEAEAGVLLSDVIARYAPFGFFPAVVPGTQFVTLGGAIANDVHGKNHHRRGTFGAHVVGFVLLRSDGKAYRCSADRNAHLFHATIGGMGLTGLILSATIRLMRVGSLDIIETATPFRSIEDYFDLAEAADRDNEYAVAWIDQLAAGSHAGRGVLLAGNHAEDGGAAVAHGDSLLAVPVQPPFAVLGRPFITVFNAAYRWAKSRKTGPHRTSYGSFFFPLDGVRHWNRLYGPAGLHQHQSVIPDNAARETIPRLLATARAHGQASFLTVLKRFAAIESPGILSFPRPGYTLTLDFANRGGPTLALLDKLDAIAVDAGGAVNPYKDARMSAATFKASFPAWRTLEAQRDPAFLSRFWARTALDGTRDDMPVACAAE